MKYVLASVISLFLARPTNGQLPCQVQKLVSPGGSLTDFGSEVALHGTRAAIGAPLTRVGSSFNVGLVWTYTLVGGALLNPIALAAPDVVSDNLFGRSIALWQDRLVVGMPGDDDQGTDSGSAYVYELVNGTWTAKAKLLPPVGSQGERNGYVVDIDGDVAIVGGVGTFAAAGSLHVYERIGANWVHATSLTPSDGGALDGFGQIAAVSGDTIAVGAYGHKVGTVSQAGATYVYRRVAGTWSLEQKVTAAVPKHEAYLGAAVDISGDTLVAGANGEEMLSGRVHVFERAGTQWSEVQTLQAVNSPPGTLFGIEIALHGERMWITANGISDVPGWKNAVYEFRAVAGTWIQSAKFQPLDTPYPSYPYFGSSLSLSDGYGLASSQPGLAPVSDEEAFLFATPGFGCASLAAAPNGVSLALGGVQEMTLSLPAFAGKPYLVLGSMSWIPGVSSGTPVDGLLVPLTVDAWTLFTLQNANQPPYLSATLGVLDGFGNAQPRLMIPSNLSASLVGLQLHHAALVLEPSIPKVVATTGAVGWKFLP